jgi:Mor family transcriptional regulator
MSMHMDIKRHELFEDLVTVTEGLLKSYGTPDAAAPLIANALADELADRWGGQNMTFPKDYARAISKRDAEVYARFTGDNYAELAKEYGLTERGMYKLIKRIRDRLRRQARGAPDLFSAAGMA